MKGRIISYFLQLVLWYFFIFTPYLHDPRQFDQENFFLQYILKQIICILLFYANYFYFIPKIFKSRGLKPYLLVSTISLLSTFFLCNLVEFILIRPSDAPFLLFFSVVAIVQVFAVSTTFRLVEDYFLQLGTQKKLEEQNRIAELNFLRSQINPHFLFNTLNNINALIRLRPNEAERSVITLSELMRYMLNTSKHDTVELSKELEYITNYISLQKLRLPVDFNLKYELTGKADSQQIEPLLLIGFIENTFKHGISGMDEDLIHIIISIKENTLVLNTKNKIHKLNNIKEIISGVGLENTKKRLEIQYKNKYSLISTETSGIYEVNLKLEL